MLLQLARTEADGIFSEFDHGVHVHDTSLRLPSLNSPTIKKYSAAYTLDGQVLASTTNLEVDTLPDTWTEGLKNPGETRVFDDDQTANIRLRVAAFAARSPEGQILVFATAAPHDLIDTAVRETTVLIALLAACMLIAVLISSHLVARRITEDLQELSTTCIELRDAPDRLQIWLDGFDAMGHSTAETAALATTIRDLVSRLQRLVDVQNRFVAEAAHELRTPLTALQGELEIALRRDRDAEAYREFIENARIDSARLAKLAEKLLEAARSRIEKLQPEEISLNTALQEAVGRHARQLHEAGIRIELQTDDSKVCADTIATARVLDNLISNTVEHSGASRLSITCKNGVALIEDNGAGLPEQVRNNLFVPFAQRKSESNGLGLFIAARLMQKQDGALKLEEGGGTRWRIVFQENSTNTLTCR